MARRRGPHRTRSNPAQGLDTTKRPQTEGGAPSPGQSYIGFLHEANDTVDLSGDSDLLGLSQIGQVALTSSRGKALVGNGQNIPITRPLSARFTNYEDRRQHFILFEL